MNVMWLLSDPITRERKIIKYERERESEGGMCTQHHNTQYVSTE